MFCPECGTLGFMEGNGNIRCTNYTCGYEGPLAGKDGKGAEFTDPMTGETIDLSKAATSSETSSLRHLNEVVPETCLLYTSPSPRDRTRSRMPSSA